MLCLGISQIITYYLSFEIIYVCLCVCNCVIVLYNSDTVHLLFFLQPHCNNTSPSTYKSSLTVTVDWLTLALWVEGHDTYIIQAEVCDGSWSDFRAAGARGLQRAGKKLGAGLWSLSASSPGRRGALLHPVPPRLPECTGLWVDLHFVVSGSVSSKTYRITFVLHYIYIYILYVLCITLVLTILMSFCSSKHSPGKPHTKSISTICKRSLKETSSTSLLSSYFSNHP